MMRLTLCMIVKNEERFLDECLASARGVVDAIVLVDTGSTDRTLEIARKHGALIVEHAWNDDFAAARNAALPHVRGGFILMLDADERLGPGARRALRKALARADFDCGMLPLHDASSFGAAPEDVVSGRARRGEAVLLPRLLRVTPDLRWEGVVHEQVTSWARGKRIASIPAPIVHLGAIPELRRERGKSDRNLRLLEKRAQLEPDNPTVLAYLARELERQGDPRALEAARDAWSKLCAQSGSRPTCDVVMPVTLLAFLSIRAGSLDEALAALAQARSWCDPHPNLDLLEGLAHERRALRAQDIESFAQDLLAARELYRALEHHRGQSFWTEVMPGALGATGATRRGTVELLLAEPAAAEACFRQALALEPQSLEARLGSIEARLEQGQAAQALADLSSVLTTECADAWVLGAAAAHALGAADDARLFLKSARAALDSKPWVADFRRGRLDELERALDPNQGIDANGAKLSASVVIPAFNRLDLLRPVLIGFTRQLDAPPFEVIVVDDGSQPPVETLFDELALPARFRLITHAANRGRGAALNTGLEAARGDVVIFCDSDIAPSDRFVAEHVAFHANAPSELSTCLGALEYGVDAGLFGALAGARTNPRLRGGARAVDWTQWFTDNWSFRRNLLAERNVRFDERHRVWGWEELDVALQLQAVGATNELVEFARGSHLKAATLEGQLTSFARSIPNLELLASKHAGEETIVEWRATRSASTRALERTEAALALIWSRLQELDASAPGRLRDLNDTRVQDVAVALSDLVFRVGLTRGYVDLRESEPEAETSASADELLHKTLYALRTKTAALEDSLGAAAPPSSWRRTLAQMIADRALAA